MINLKIVCDDKKYIPAYANETDACMDLKVKIDVEKNEDKWADYSNNQERTAFLLPNENKVFGTGIKVAIPEGYVMLVYPRSSTGIKLHCMLSNTTGVIDAGYRDEIKLAITNFGDKTVCLSDGQRVAQFLIIPRPQINLIETKDDEDFRQNDRGGGIGSSGV